MLNPLCYVVVTIYFEIRNAAVYGGPGSVGYSSITLNGVGRPEEIDDSCVEAQRQAVAKLLGVPTEDVTVITKDAYDAATEEPEDCEDEAVLED